MRKYFGAIAALLLLVTPAHAADVQRVPLAIAWDMDGEAADDDQIVTSANLADATTYTIAAQPDTCRVVDITVTDANSSTSAGVLTVTGLDCWGDAQTCTFTFAAGGSGVKSLTYGTGSSTTCAFSSITSVITGTLTGEEGAGTDLLKVGYTANSAYSYPIYGKKVRFKSFSRWIDPFSFYKGIDDVYASSTTLTSVHSYDGGAFDNVSVGDLLELTVEGLTYERLVTARASDDSITINAALPTNVATTDLIKMRFKKRFVLVEANDAWIPVDRRENAFFNVDVDANANTGGVVSSIQCGIYENNEINNIVEVDTDTVASAATGANTTSIDLRLAPFTHCRAGLKFGTGDDTDSANEDINVFALIRR